MTLEEFLNAKPTESSLEPLRRLFPQYIQVELEEAFDNLMRYCAIGWHIADRILREQPDFIERMKKEGRFDLLPLSENRE